MCSYKARYITTHTITTLFKLLLHHYQVLKNTFIQIWIFHPNMTALKHHLASKHHPHKPPQQKALLQTYRAVLVLREAALVLLTRSFFFHIPPADRRDSTCSQVGARWQWGEGEAGREGRRMRPAYLVLSLFPSSPVNSELFPLIYIRTLPPSLHHFLSSSRHIDTPLNCRWIIFIRQA